MAIGQQRQQAAYPPSETMIFVKFSISLEELFALAKVRSSYAFHNRI